MLQSQIGALIFNENLIHLQLKGRNAVKRKSKILVKILHAIISTPI